MRRLVYHATAWLLRAPLLPFSTVRVLHGERADFRGGCVLASNHISHFDPPLISTVVRRHIHWMATAGLFRNRLVGAWLRAAAAFPIDRARADRSSVKTTLERLRRGHLVGVFPEGGIRDGAASILGGATMIPGLGTISEMTGAPVLPCVILGSDRLYARSTYRLFHRRIRIWIGFGEPIRPQDEGKLARAAMEAELAEAMRAVCREMVETFQLIPEDLPQPPRQRMQAIAKK